MNTVSSRRKALGITLIELGMVIVFVSLAMVPVIQMIGGPRSGSGQGTADRVSEMKSKEAVLANTMVEKVLSNDYQGFNCNAAGDPVAFDPSTDLPANGQNRTYGLCLSQNYNTPLYYQWSVLNLNDAALNGFAMPSQNEYYQATFNVLDRPGGEILLTMPTYFFYNDGAFSQQSTRTGVMLAMDISGSMLESCDGGGPACRPGEIDEFGSPFMFYRYDRNRYNGNSWGGDANFNPASVPGVLPGTNRVYLNMWDNNELDMVYAQALQGSQNFSDPEATTEYNEKFPYGRTGENHPTWGDGLLGSGNCSAAPASPLWDTDLNLIHTFLPNARSNKKTLLNGLCDWKVSSAPPANRVWSDILNRNLSRIEAARTASLSLLLELESSPSVVQSVDIGFIPWNTTPNVAHQVTLESAVSVPGVPGLHFRNMRERLLWINRADPSNKHSALPIKAKTFTQIHDGVEYARQRLMAGNYDRRIIVLLTDGAPRPNIGTNSTAGFGGGGLRDYTRNTFGNNAPVNQQITLFTVGLIGADEPLMRDMARSTPDGQEFIANDITSLKGIFESVSYQIQKLALLNTADRYGITF